MALTNWASQRQEMFSGSSQGVPSGCRAGLGLDYASLVVSSSSGGEAGLALGALEMRTGMELPVTSSPKQVRHPEKNKNKQSRVKGCW